MRAHCLFLAVILLIELSASHAAAQAWAPAKHRGTISVTYKNLYIKHHTDVSGLKFDRGRIRSNVVSLDVDYGLSRRWAVNLSLPYSRVKYTGSSPHVDPDQNVDDGDYHGGVQDLRFGARYAWLRYSPVVVTPFAEVVLPSHDYVTFAHSAIGRRLKEMMVGANIGWRNEDSFLSNGYFQTRISYGFVERVLGRSHNRTNIDAELSYFLTPRLGVSALTSLAKHHGGLDWDSTKGSPSQQWTAEELYHHDELTRADAFDIGIGTSFRLSSSMSVHATLFHNAWSRNAHPLNTGVTLGVSRSFRTARPPQLPPDPDSGPVFTIPR